MGSDRYLLVGVAGAEATESVSRNKDGVREVGGLVADGELAPELAGVEAASSAFFSELERKRFLGNLRVKTMTSVV